MENEEMNNVEVEETELAEIDSSEGSSTRDTIVGTALVSAGAILVWEGGKWVLKKAKKGFKSLKNKMLAKKAMKDSKKVITLNEEDLVYPDEATQAKAK